MARMRWTREAVVEAVARLGGPVRASELRRLNPSLYHAAWRCFRSWREALQAAGIETPRSIRHPDWTRDRVIDAVRQRHARGEPLASGAANRSTPGLHAAARRLFGTWRAALEAAGVPYPSVRPSSRWTREGVLETIRERSTRGQSIGYARIRIEAAGLFEAARRIFGSWKAAVGAAGLSYPSRPVARRWKPEAIFAAIRERRDSGLPLRATETGRGRSGLLQAARREFGSWREALDAAGVPRPASPTPRRPRRWTPQAIVAAVRERHAAGHAIQIARVSREAGGLYGAARREFGSWRAAVEAAGLSYPESRPRISWTRERVIASIRERHQAGRPITATGVERNAGGLVQAGRNLFGSWSAAVEAAGIAYPGRLRSKRWTHDELLDALRGMEREHGFAGAWRLDRFRREGYENLRLAIRREFGSLGRAKELAGLRTWPLWTRERVREAILRRRDRGESLARGLAQKQNPRLVAGADRAYGSWATALTACGIASPLPGKPSWPRDEILNALKKERSPEGLVRWADLRLKYPGLRRAALVQFGSWSAALSAAGVGEPSRERTGRWTREKVLEAVKQDEREQADLSRESVRARRGGGLVQAGLRHFGSWDGTLRAAGLAIPQHARAAAQWTREQMLETINEEWRERGDVRRFSVQARRGSGLVKAAHRDFGNWREAVRAAGVPATKPDEWPSEKVIEALKADAGKGLDLGRNAVQSRRGWTFTQAARSHFGRWADALSAAGVARAVKVRPSKWTCERLLEIVRQDRREGRDLATKPAAGRHGRGILKAARSHFGGWEEALRAAGVPVPSGGPREKWTAERIVALIREEWRSHRKSSVRWVKRLAPGILPAAYRHFGGWSGAVEAAGVPISTQGQARYFTKEEVIATLRKEWRSRKDVRSTSLRKREGYSFLRTAKRHFGSWAGALEAAGVPPSAGTKWTSEIILKMIRKAWRKKRDVRAASVTRGRAGLLTAAYRCFGGWRAAVSAAGVQPPGRRLVPPDWTRERVLRALKREARRRGDLSPSAFQAREDGLPAAIHRHFGRLARALRAAGLGAQGSPGPREGETLRIPCRRCGAAAGISFVVASGTQELRCTKCGGTTRVEARLEEGSGWRILTG